MNVFKKLFASVATFSLVASMVPTAVLGQTQFNSEIQGAYDYAYANQITTVTPIDGAMPFGTTTRAQLAKMIVNWAKSLNMYSINPELAGQCNGFDDLAAFRQLDKGLADSIVMACEGGLMGLDGNGKPATSFNPNGTVSRGQIITTISRVLYGNTYDGGEPFYAKHVTALMDAGIITQERAMDNVARYEAWLMLMRASDADTTPACEDPMVQLSCALDLPDCPDVCKDNMINTGNVFTGKDGMVNFSLSSSTPMARSVPAVGIVPMSVYTVSAGDKDIQLSSITVKRIGLGNRSDISRIYFERNGVRVSGRQTIGVDDTATVTFSPAIVLKAGSSEELTLVATLSGTAGGEHAFTVEKAEMVDSSAETVAGNFPIISNFQKLTNYAVLELAFDRGGSSSTYKVGDKSVELGQFKLQNNDANKTARFMSITFRNEGSGDPARSLTNLVLKRNNEVISTKPAVINGKYVTFPVDNVISGGINATYTISADIIGAENTSGDTYQFRLQYSDDVNAVESNTLFKSKVSITNSTLPTYTVDGGDVVLSRPNGFMVSQTVSPGSNDIVLLKSELNVRQNVRLGDVTISFDTGSFTGNVAGYFTTLKLRINDRIVSTVNPTNNNTSFTFEGVTDITANTTLEVLGNIRATTPGSATFRIGTIGASQFAIKEYINNGNVVNSFIGTIQGIATTVDQTTLSVVKNDGLSNSSIIRGTAGKNIFGLKITAGQTSDVTITQIRFNNIGTNAFVGLSTFSLFNSGTIIASNSMAADGNSGTVTLNLNPSIRIPRNTSINLMLKADISSSVATGSVLQMQLVTGNMAGTDENGNSLASILSFTPVNSASFVITQDIAVNASLGSNSAMLLGANMTANIMVFTLNTAFGDGRVTDLYFVTTGSAQTNLTDKINTVEVLAGNATYPCRVVSSGGIRCDLGRSSTLVVTKDVTKELTLRLTMANITSATGLYYNNVGTGLSLQLGTGNPGQIPSLETSQGGISNGVRIESVDSAATALVSLISPVVSSPHRIAGTVPVIAIGQGNIDANNAFRFTVTPQGGTTVMQSITVEVKQANDPSLGLSLYRSLAPEGQPINGPVVCTTPSAGIWRCTFNITTYTQISSQTNFLVYSTVPGNPQSIRNVNIIEGVFMDSFNDGGTGSLGSGSLYNIGIPSATTPTQF